jgi:hypothetical protein
LLNKPINITKCHLPQIIRWLHQIEQHVKLW